MMTNCMMQRLVHFRNFLHVDRVVSAPMWAERPRGAHVTGGRVPAGTEEAALAVAARSTAVAELHGRLGLENVDHTLLVGPHQMRADELHVGRGRSTLERHLLLVSHKLVLLFFIVVAVGLLHTQIISLPWVEIV